MVLCMAAYLALILLTWTYLGEDGWPDLQVRAHSSIMIDTIPSSVGSWQRSPDAVCLAGTFLVLTLSPFGHIQVEDGFPLPRLNSEGMQRGLRLWPKSPMTSYASDEHAVACSLNQPPHSLDSAQIENQLDYDYTFNSLCHKLIHSTLNFLDYHLEAFC